MRNFLISNDPNFRTAVELEDGTLVGFPHLPGSPGAADGRNPVVLPGFHALSDTAGISERSHMPDPIIGSLVTRFTETLPL